MSMAEGNTALQIAKSPRSEVDTTPPPARAPNNLSTPPVWPASPPHGAIAIPPNSVDVRLVDQLGADTALREGILPLRRAGALTVVAAVDPAAAEAARGRLETLFGSVAIAQASRDAIECALVQTRQSTVADRAEQRTRAAFSCRHLGTKRAVYGWVLGGLAVTLAALAFPVALFGVLVAWAAMCLFLSTLLRVAAAVAAGKDQPTQAAMVPTADLPTISILVPLFREKDIAERLVRRLSSLDYPADRLDICLIVEKYDTITRAALSETRLPPHMRQIVVPPGNLQTKPRAMNYTLDFTRGDIVGIYDAEDAPAPDQLRIVAAEFAAAPPDVACLQGRLDFYNPRANWLARCFTIDYAIWFRAILPGIAALGLPVPLGGTTLFFRRDVLEKLGAWDAHNVTEDADLGIRLARHGWRTRLIATTTEEEANCRLWPWIKQRSRWIKGYALTWAVHMRKPRRLWSDLGPWRFFGFQVVFLGALSQFVLAPLLWSFWLVLLGLPHPLADALPGAVVLGLATLFFAAELTNITIGAWACRREKHRWLIPWVPTMHLYFPLAALASWKGIGEIVRHPFYWDKTDHGAEAPDQSASSRPQHPGSDGSRTRLKYAP
ncbi:MAG: glycosyltransferase family 2 protein [Pseudomonadota bacterium]